MKQLNSYQYHVLMTMPYTLDDDYKHSLEREYGEKEDDTDSIKANDKNRFRSSTEVKSKKSKG